MAPGKVWSSGWRPDRCPAIVVPIPRPPIMPIPPILPVRRCRHPSCHHPSVPCPSPSPFRTRPGSWASTRRNWRRRRLQEGRSLRSKGLLLGLEQQAGAALAGGPESRLPQPAESAEVMQPRNARRRNSRLVDTLPSSTAFAMLTWQSRSNVRGRRARRLCCSATLPHRHCRRGSRGGRRDWRRRGGWLWSGRPDARRAATSRRV